MSLNFPDSPTAGTVFGAWRYDGTKWGAVSGFSGGGGSGDITAVLAGAGLSGGGTEGDVSLTLSVPVTVARGGTGATDAAAARTSLGAAPLDQNVTLTGDVSGSGAQSSVITTVLAPVDLTTKVTGILPIASGGTGSATAAAAPWVETAGDTMSGSLTINSSAAATLTLTGPGGVWPTFIIAKATGSPALGNQIVGRTAANNRWIVLPGNANTETGSGNTGSDFSIERYNDAGAVIDTPLSISRATGQATMAASLNVTPAAGVAQINVRKPASGQQALISGYTGANARWSVVLGDATAESGGTGSNFGIVRYNDAGAAIDVPVTINRATSKATFTVAPDIVGGASATTNGWVSLPNGLILQWGTAAGGAATINITFPLAFPTNALNVQATMTGDPGTAGLMCSTAIASRTAFAAYPRYVTGATVGNATQNIHWMAIGY